MRKNTIILLVAVLAAFVSFLLVFKFLKDASKPKHRYVMAKAIIPKESVIQLDQLTYTPPQEAVQDETNLFVQMVDVTGKIATKEIKPNDWILRSSVKEKELPPAPKVIEIPKEMVQHKTIPMPEGMEGLNVSAANILDIPTDLAPGNYVDILASIPNYAGQKELTTLIHSSQVISIETETAPVTAIKSVRFALLPKETKAVLTALDQGKLRLIILAEMGKKPWTGPTLGSMEIIRANGQQKTVLSGRISEESKNIFTIIDQAAEQKKAS